MSNLHKIIFAGLDSAGKTSILAILDDKFSLINSIKPTKGQQRDFVKIMGFQIARFDLGGQKMYRADYFKTKYRIFYEVASVFYVIDVTDSKRYEEAYEYFENIYETMEKLGEFPKFNICLHKVDPGLRKKRETQNSIEEIKKKLQEIARETPLNFYITTIHDKSTLVKAFSEGLMEFSPKSTIIRQQLREFAQLTFSSAVLLLDDNSFLIGAHYSKKEYFEVCQTVAPRFSITIERVGEYKLEIQNIMAQLKIPIPGSEDETVTIFCKPFEYLEGRPFYAVTLTRNEKTIPLTMKYLPELTNSLQDVFNSFV